MKLITNSIVEPTPGQGAGECHTDDQEASAVDAVLGGVTGNPSLAIGVGAGRADAG
jgi:hypothetical protein